MIVISLFKDVSSLYAIINSGNLSIFNELLEGKEIATEIPFTSLYGKKTYVTLKGVPIFENDKFAGAVLLINDITERKQAEEELKKRLNELEIYYNATLGREKRIIELKHEVNKLLTRLDEKTKYGV